jgi:hypothetical protein
MSSLLIFLLDFRIRMRYNTAFRRSTQSKYYLYFSLTIKNDWKQIYKTETEMRWDTLCCNASFRICNHQRTAYKEHHKDWNNTHSNVRTSRGFSVNTENF